MIAHFEDGPPCVPARQYRDVIDHGNAIAAEARAKKLRAEQVENNMPKSTMKNHAGEVYGDLTVLPNFRSTKGGVQWECLCKCGVRKFLFMSSLRGGQMRRGYLFRGQRSCGCKSNESRVALLTKHGKGGPKRTGAYKTWNYMVQRCVNPNDTAFAHYGGRGIKVCQKWLAFEGFFEDMGERPPGHSIERIDVNGDYEPANCRWATWPEQCRNKRTTVRITYLGETLTLSEWAKKSGLHASTLGSRIKRGVPLAQALGLRYQVHYGTMQCCTQHFSTFDGALEFLADHVDDDFAPLLVGAFHDPERDGLTSDERDTVAAAMDLRTPRNARRA